jgi:hypothetical protein
LFLRCLFTGWILFLRGFPRNKVASLVTTRNKEFIWIKTY